MQPSTTLRCSLDCLFDCFHLAAGRPAERHAQPLIFGFSIMRACPSRKNILRVKQAKYLPGIAIYNRQHKQPPGRHSFRDHAKRFIWIRHNRLRLPAMPPDPAPSCSPGKKDRRA